MVNRENLIATAIRDETAIFTSTDILVAVGIDLKEVHDIHKQVDNNIDELVKEILKNKAF